MEIPFSKEEIKKVTFDLGADKAPGLDGFLLSFFQKYWTIVEHDIISLYESFYDGSVNLERINWASIALFSKKDNQKSAADFRPICLINYSFKILSKILASLMSRILNFLIDHSQTAFMKGCCILDNITIA